MATTKIWTVKDSLKRLTDYASNPEKTEYSDLRNSIEYAVRSEKTAASSNDIQEKFFFVSGINCNPETASNEMNEVKELFGKTGGNLAYHCYQSFKPGEVTPELCHQLGVELARRMWGDKYQVLVATHLDKNHLHNHIIVNSVSFVDGKKYNCNKNAYWKLRETSDKICLENNLSVIESPKAPTPRAIYFAEKAGEPTKYNLMREAIDDAISMSTNYAMFQAVLNRKGYQILNPNRKYPVIKSINAKRGTRFFRLGEDYTPERIMDRIRENDSRVKGIYYSYMYPEPKRNKKKYVQVNTTRRKAKKIGGLYGLYLHYCYLLGVLPKRNNYRPLSPELREDLRKAEKYSEQVRLMCRENIKTTEDANIFIDKTSVKIKDLTDERRKIYNKLRRCKDPEEIKNLKQNRDAITKELVVLRKDNNNAKDLLERSLDVKRNVEIERRFQHPERYRERVRERGLAR